MSTQSSCHAKALNVLFQAPFTSSRSQTPASGTSPAHDVAKGAFLRGSSTAHPKRSQHILLPPLKHHEELDASLSTVVASSRSSSLLSNAPPNEQSHTFPQNPLRMQDFAHLSPNTSFPESSPPAGSARPTSPDLVPPCHPHTGHTPPAASGYNSLHSMTAPRPLRSRKPREENDTVQPPTPSPYTHPADAKVSRTLAFREDNHSLSRTATLPLRPPVRDSVRRGITATADAGVHTVDKANLSKSRNERRMPETDRPVFRRAARRPSGVTATTTPPTDGACRTPTHIPAVRPPDASTGPSETHEYGNGVGAPTDPDGAASTSANLAVAVAVCGTSNASVLAGPSDLAVAGAIDAREKGAEANNGADFPPAGSANADTPYVVDGYAHRGACIPRPVYASVSVPMPSGTASARTQTSADAAIVCSSSHDMSQDHDDLGATREDASSHSYGRWSEAISPTRSHAPSVDAHALSAGRTPSRSRNAALLPSSPATRPQAPPHSPPHAQSHAYLHLLADGAAAETPDREELRKGETAGVADDANGDVGFASGNDRVGDGNDVTYGVPVLVAEVDAEYTSGQGMGEHEKDDTGSGSVVEGSGHRGFSGYRGRPISAHQHVSGNQEKTGLDGADSRRYKTLLEFSEDSDLEGWGAEEGTDGKEREGSRGNSANDDNSRVGRVRRVGLRDRTHQSAYVDAEEDDDDEEREESAWLKQGYWRSPPEACARTSSVYGDSGDVDVYSETTSQDPPRDQMWSASSSYLGGRGHSVCSDSRCGGESREGREPSPARAIRIEEEKSQHEVSQLRGRLTKLQRRQQALHHDMQDAVQRHSVYIAQEKQRSRDLLRDVGRLRELKLALQRRVNALMEIVSKGALRRRVQEEESARERLRVKGASGELSMDKTLKQQLVNRNRREITESLEKRREDYTHAQQQQHAKLEEQRQRQQHECEQRRQRDEERLAEIQQRRQERERERDQRKKQKWVQREERRARVAQMQEERERAHALQMQHRDECLSPTEMAGDGTGQCRSSSARQSYREPSAAMKQLVGQINRTYSSSVWARRSAEGLPGKRDGASVGAADGREGIGDCAMSGSRVQRPEQVNSGVEQGSGDSDDDGDRAGGYDCADNTNRMRSTDAIVDVGDAMEEGANAGYNDGDHGVFVSAADNGRNNATRGDASSGGVEREEESCAPRPRANVRSKWDKLYVERMERAFSIHQRPPRVAETTGSGSDDEDVDGDVCLTMPEPAPVFNVASLSRKSQQQQRSMLLEAQMAVYALQKQAEKEKMATERRKQREKELQLAQRAREQAQKQREETVKERRAQLDAEQRMKTIASYEDRERQAAERREKQQQEKEQMIRSKREMSNNRHLQALKYVHETQHVREKRVLTRQRLEDEAINTQKEVSELEVQFLNVLKAQEEEKKRELTTRQIAMKEARRERMLCNEMERKLVWLEKTIQSLQDKGLDLSSFNYHPIPPSIGTDTGGGTIQTRADDTQ